MKIPVISLVSILGANFARAANDYPVVLIHGFAGTSESFEYSTELEDAGMTTLIVDVGKVTSNWKRACDTYAQVMGTLTDYGACHSETYGHARYGDDFTGNGLYDSWSEENPVHIMGHSMGASTARMLEYLLREGSGCADDTSELFTGGHNYIASITGLSGAFSGATLVDLLDDTTLLGLLKVLIIGSIGSVDDGFLDDDMTYWGIEREEGESFSDFWDDLTESGILSPDHEDIGTYDLSPEGAAAFNSIAEMTYSDTFYFSFASELMLEQDCWFFFSCDTYYIPAIEMTWYLQPIALVIAGDPDPDKQENDGLMNWENQLCPFTSDDELSLCVEFDGTWEAGTWTYIDVDYLDHFQISQRDDDDTAASLYTAHAARLLAL